MLTSVQAWESWEWEWAQEQVQVQVPPVQATEEVMLQPAVLAAVVVAAVRMMSTAMTMLMLLVSWLQRRCGCSRHVCSVAWA